MPAPLSLRLTQEERETLEQAAKGQTLSAYVRQRLFGTDVKLEGRVGEIRLSPMERQKLLAQILAELGSSRIGKSLAELAEAAQVGILPLSPDVLSEIRAACAHVRDLRAMLLRGLGLSPEKQP